MPHAPFPKIGQFKEFLSFARKGGFTTAVMTATVKVHGTNGGIRFHDDGRVIPQSRNRDLSLGDDNCGFAKFVSGLPTDVLQILRQFARPCEAGAVVYGEWAGRGIQSGVAVSDVEPFFYLFETSIEPTESQVKRLKAARVFLPIAVSVPTFVGLRDDLAVARLSEVLAQACVEVENRCPVGLQYFGVDGIGEGFVVTAELTKEDAVVTTMFKVKGAKHSASKTRQLVPLDVEKVASIQAFGDQCLTEARLNQGLDYLREMGKPLTLPSTGDFVRWVVNDVFTECADVFQASNLNDREARSEIGKRAAAFYRKAVSSGT